MREFRRVLRAAVESGGARGTIDTVVMGLTGAGSPPAVLAQYRQIARDETAGHSIRIEPDGYTSLVGAAGGEIGLVGIVVIAGGGSIAYGVGPDGRRHRAGGWGYTVGDEGSAYDIGRSTLNLALRRFDGRETETGGWLASAIEERFGGSPLPTVARMLAHSQDRVPLLAGIAPLTVEAAAHGDAGANAILRRAGRELAALAIAVARSMDRSGDVHIFPVGGVFNDATFVSRYFQEHLHRELPEAEVREPKYPPVIGAALVALGSNVTIRTRPSDDDPGGVRTGHHREVGDP